MSNCTDSPGLQAKTDRKKAETFQEIQPTLELETGAGEVGEAGEAEEAGETGEAEEGGGGGTGGEGTPTKWQYNDKQIQK